MQRQHTGRPGSTVIPAGWSAAGAGVVDLTHPAVVTIGQAGGTPAYNSTSNQTETTAVAPVYSGGATLMLATPDRAALVVDDPTAVAVYEVTLPYAASSGVAVGQVVTVAADPDPMLAGKVLRVASIERGSRRFSRVLLAVLLN